MKFVQLISQVSSIGGIPKIVVHVSQVQLLPTADVGVRIEDRPGNQVAVVLQRVIGCPASSLDQGQSFVEGQAWLTSSDVTVRNALPHTYIGLIQEEKRPNQLSYRSAVYSLDLPLRVTS